MTAFDDAGGGFLSALTIMGYGDLPAQRVCPWRVMVRLSARARRFEQAVEVPIGLGSADLVHRGPRFSVWRDMGAVWAGGKRRQHYYVIAALVAAIHVGAAEKDARNRSGHDDAVVGGEGCPDTRNESGYDDVRE